MRYICLDCGRYILEENIIWSSLDAYDDDPEPICPLCENNQVIASKEEDGP